MRGSHQAVQPEDHTRAASGLAGRLEVSVEVVENRRGTGTGRALLSEALGLVSVDDFVFAAVSPGNARSLRAFLAQGFVPVASEVIITALRIKTNIPAVRRPTM